MLPRPPSPDPTTPTESLLAELNIKSMLSKRGRNAARSGVGSVGIGQDSDFEWDSDFNTETTEKCSLLAADHSMMRSLAESEESADR